MRIKKQSLLFVLFGLLFMTSCTIQKRTVNKGYFVQWNWNKKVSKIESKPSDLLVKQEQSVSEVKAISSFQTPQPEVVSPTETEQLEKLEKIDEKSSKKLAKTISFTQKPVREVKSTFSKGKKTIAKKANKQRPAYMDWEQIINIILLVLFAVLSVVFLLLALKASGVLFFVYLGLAVLCFVLFVTQVIDVILY